MKKYRFLNFILLLSFVFIFSFALAGCNSGSGSKKSESDDSKVTQAEWNAAMSPSSFSNCKYTETEDNVSVTIINADDLICIVLEQETYMYEHRGSDYFMYSQKEDGSWIYTDISPTRYEDGRIYRRVSDIADELPYGSFTYVEAEKAYKATLTMDGERIQVVVKFQNKKLIFVSYSAYGEALTLAFSDYGKCSIALPANATYEGGGYVPPVGEKTMSYDQFKSYINEEYFQNVRVVINKDSNRSVITFDGVNLEYQGTYSDGDSLDYIFTQKDGNYYVYDIIANDGLMSDTDYNSYYYYTPFKRVSDIFASIYFDELSPTDSYTYTGESYSGEYSIVVKLDETNKSRVKMLSVIYNNNSSVTVEIYYGNISVKLPETTGDDPASNPDPIVAGKVTEEEWNKNFEQYLAFDNYSYSVEVSYMVGLLDMDASYSVCRAGNALLFSNIYGEEYYEKDGDDYYSYIEEGGVYVRSEASGEYFENPLSFLSDIEGFTFSAFAYSDGAYRASIGSAYYTLTFAKGKIVSYYESVPDGGYRVSFYNTGNTYVVLPSEYYEPGKITEQEWNAAISTDKMSSSVATYYLGAATEYQEDIFSHEYIFMEKGGKDRYFINKKGGHDLVYYKEDGKYYVTVYTSEYVRYEITEEEYNSYNSGAFALMLAELLPYDRFTYDSDLDGYTTDNGDVIVTFDTSNAIRSILITEGDNCFTWLFSYSEQQIDIPDARFVWSDDIWMLCPSDQISQKVTKEEWDAALDMSAAYNFISELYSRDDQDEFVRMDNNAAIVDGDVIRYFGGEYDGNYYEKSGNDYFEYKFYEGGYYKRNWLLDDPSAPYHFEQFYDLLDGITDFSEYTFDYDKLQYCTTKGRKTIAVAIVNGCLSAITIYYDHDPKPWEGRNFYSRGDAFVQLPERLSSEEFYDAFSVDSFSSVAFIYRVSVEGEWGYKENQVWIKDGVTFWRQDEYTYMKEWYVHDDNYYIIYAKDDGTMCKSYISEEEYFNHSASGYWAFVDSLIPNNSDMYRFTYQNNIYTYELYSEYHDNEPATVIITFDSEKKLVSIWCVDSETTYEFTFIASGNDVSFPEDFPSDIE